MLKNLKINANLAYDYDISQIYFEENFEVIKHKNYYNNSLLIYTMNNELNNYFEVDQDVIIENNKYNNTMINYILVHEFNIAYSYIKDQILEDKFNNYILCEYNLDNIHELKELLTDYKIDFTSNYVSMKIRGYNTVTQILINKDEFKKINKCEFIEDHYQEYFSNLLNNSPIYGNINISFNKYVNTVTFNYNDTFNYDEFCKDEYDVDINSLDIIKVIINNFNTKLNLEDIKQIKDQIKKIDYGSISC